MLRKTTSSEAPKRDDRAGRRAVWRPPVLTVLDVKETEDDGGDDDWHHHCWHHHGWRCS